MLALGAANRSLRAQPAIAMGSGHGRRGHLEDEAARTADLLHRHRAGLRGRPAQPPDRPGRRSADTRTAHGRRPAGGGRDRRLAVPDVPEDGQAWRDTLSYLDADAGARCGSTFAAVPEDDQVALIQSVFDADDWHGLPADRTCTPTRPLPRRTCGTSNGSMTTSGSSRFSSTAPWIPRPESSVPTQVRQVSASHSGQQTPSPTESSTTRSCRTLLRLLLEPDQDDHHVVVGGARTRPQT
jgi:hypothetical protein